MVSPKEQLMVFEKIENELITEIFNLADENIITAPIEKEKIIKIIGDGFTDIELYHVNHALFNFVSSQAESTLLKVIESSQLSTDKKNILKDIFRIIQKRISPVLA